MVTIYAWLEIRATYLDEDLHPEIDEKKVFDDIDNLIKKLKYNELKVIEKNYSRFVQFSVMENHKTERTEEMISMYENITKIARVVMACCIIWMMKMKYIVMNLGF